MKYKFACEGTCTFYGTIDADTPEDAWAKAQQGKIDWHIDEDSAEAETLACEFSDENGAEFRGKWWHEIPPSPRVTITQHSTETAIQEEIAKEVWAGSWACLSCKGLGQIGEGPRDAVWIEVCPLCNSPDITHEASLIRREERT